MHDRTHGDIMPLEYKSLTETSAVGYLEYEALVETSAVGYLEYETLVETSARHCICTALERCALLLARDECHHCFFLTGFKLVNEILSMNQLLQCQPHVMFRVICYPEARVLCLSICS